MAQLRTEWLVHEDTTNALVAWTLVVLGTLAATVALLSGNAIRASGAALLVVIAAVPSLGRSWRRAFVWPMVLVVTLPTHFVAYGPGVLADAATSLSLATFALAVVVDLHLVTDVRLSTGFTAGFVVIATMGFAGFWSVFAWVTHLTLDTGFVETGDELMVLLLGATGAGIAVGVGFEWFARRQVASSVSSGGAPT